MTNKRGGNALYNHLELMSIQAEVLYIMNMLDVSQRLMSI